MIPVHPTGEIERTKPDDILILPWPLAPEIVRQLAGARAWGARFLVAMPHLEILDDRGRPFRFIAPMPSLDLPRTLA